jgi:quercetin dioxygenase-like cupin family protein
MSSNSTPKSLEDLQAREIVKGFRGKFIHTNTMTFAYWDIDAGSALPLHDHPHEQVLNMLEGEFELVLDGQTMKLKPGEVVPIPSGVPHSGTAITNCRILDVFHPVREDYR